MSRFAAAPQHEPAETLIRFTNVRDALVQGCAPRGLETFLRIEGEQSSRIAVLGNDLSRVSQPIYESAAVPENAVTVAGNLLAG